MYFNTNSSQRPYRVVQPICLGGFVGYFSQTNADEITLSDAYWYATGIVISTAFMTLTFHPFILYIFKTACKVRVACSGLVYRKSLRLRKSSAEEGQNGQIINLLSNDLSKFDIGLAFLHDVWKGPLEALTFFIVIYLEIGIAAVVGMAFLVSFIPLQGKSIVLIHKYFDLFYFRIPHEVICIAYLPKRKNIINSNNITI